MIFLLLATERSTNQRKDLQTDWSTEIAIVAYILFSIVVSTLIKQIRIVYTVIIENILKLLVTVKEISMLINKMMHPL